MNVQAGHSWLCQALTGKHHEPNIRKDSHQHAMGTNNPIRYIWIGESNKMKYTKKPAKIDAVQYTAT